MNIDNNEYLEKIFRLDGREFIDFLFDNRFLLSEFNCIACKDNAKFVKYARNIDGYAWRYYNIKCKNYKKYFSIRIGSFFEGFAIDIKYILKFVVLRLGECGLNSIEIFFDNKKKNTVKKSIE
ncbi:hypothetical protein DMUE_3864 [Dictyocoela muelleri]|nr:hypothetical protein DMUE_3864 [Dictyocoela muelleri]